MKFYQLLILVATLVLFGCKDTYICNLPVVNKYQKGQIVVVKALNEKVRIISHWEPFGGSKEYKCKVEADPEYTVRFADGSEIVYNHSELGEIK